MTYMSMSRVLHIGRGALLIALALAPVPAPAGAQSKPVNPQAASQAEFQARLQEYLQLRADLAKKLEPLSTTASGAELTARQANLAAAIRAARKDAMPGDLIPAGAAQLIRGIIVDDFHVRNAKVTRATLEEVPHAPRPVINKTYPSQEALPTMPPLLLEKLPRLPDNLQYRFYGRHVVILDGDTQLIIDYIANVLPAH